VANLKFGFKKTSRNYKTIKVSFSDDDVIDISFKKITRKNDQNIKVKDLIKLDE